MYDIYTLYSLTIFKTFNSNNFIVDCTINFKCPHILRFWILRHRTLIFHLVGFLGMYWRMIQYLPLYCIIIKIILSLFTKFYISLHRSLISSKNNLISPTRQIWNLIYPWLLQNHCVHVNIILCAHNGSVL